MAVAAKVRHNNDVTTLRETADWNSFGRANASQKWRRQSAAMGNDMTRAIVAAAQVQTGMRVLDIACGTGEPAISLATDLAGGGEVVGIDISPAPLKIAAERATQRSLSNVTFQQADAHHLPFADSSFDCITSRLGVMFFSDLPRALGEMRRVLKPEGRAILLVWGPMNQPYFQTTIGTVLHMLPSVVTPESGQKMFALGEKGVLSQALRLAGFSQVKEELVTVPWTWMGTPEEVWEYFQDVTVPFASLIQSIPADRRDEIDAEVVKAISQYYDGASIKFTATVNIAVAVK
ncbi:MAG TPA: methyltransferase domain-containing protein [Candidatus Angelobacter sp.]|nr:methyltransferase domain-containing protein [Candidatus Angelobacter sp.]